MKFNIILTFLLSTNAYSAFTDNQCLNSQFGTKVSHQAEPFGLAKRELIIEKSNCVINIKHEKLRFMKSHWMIDVCRGPVHIKRVNKGITVLKKEKKCPSSNEFCSNYKEVKEILADDGLIFAEGEKENLNTPHGQVQCTYLILEAYLKRNTVFGLHKNYSNQIVIENIPSKSLIPEVIEISKPVESAVLENVPATPAPERKGEANQTVEW